MLIRRDPSSLRPAIRGRIICAVLLACVTTIGPSGNTAQAAVPSLRCDQRNEPIQSILGFRHVTRQCRAKTSGKNSSHLFASRRKYSRDSSANTALRKVASQVPSVLRSGWSVAVQDCSSTARCYFVLRGPKINGDLYEGTVDIEARYAAVCLDEDAATTGMCDRLVGHYSVLVTVKSFVSGAVGD